VKLDELRNNCDHGGGHQYQRFDVHYTDIVK